MKAIFLFTGLLLLGFGVTNNCQAQDLSIEPRFDSILAQKLGADDYGMAQYFFVMLRSGENKLQDQHLRDSIMIGHMANISRLADEGKLFLAGPFGKNDLQWRGLFVLVANDTIEVRQMLSADPAVSGRYLNADIVPWYGSAAVKEINEIHRTIQKKSF